jgi:hypothetical protein
MTAPLLERCVKCGAPLLSDDPPLEPTWCLDCITEEPLDPIEEQKEPTS